MLSYKHNSLIQENLMQKKQKKEKEPKEIKPGPPVEAVMAIATALLLVVALVMLDYVKGVHYGEGSFFADSYGASE